MGLNNRKITDTTWGEALTAWIIWDIYRDLRGLLGLVLGLFRAGHERAERAKRAQEYQRVLDRQVILTFQEEQEFSIKMRQRMRALNLNPDSPADEDYWFSLPESERWGD